MEVETLAILHDMITMILAYNEINKFKVAFRYIEVIIKLKDRKKGEILSSGEDCYFE